MRYLAIQIRICAHLVECAEQQPRSVSRSAAQPRLPVRAPMQSGEGMRRRSMAGAARKASRIVTAAAKCPTALECARRALRLEMLCCAAAADGRPVLCLFLCLFARLLGSVHRLWPLKTESLCCVLLDCLIARRCRERRSRRRLYRIAAADGRDAGDKVIECDMSCQWRYLCLCARLCVRGRACMRSCSVRVCVCGCVSAHACGWVGVRARGRGSPWRPSGLGPTNVYPSHTCGTTRY